MLLEVAAHGRPVAVGLVDEAVVGQRDGSPKPGGEIQDQVVRVGMFRVELVHDLAVTHHQDAVAQREKLLGFAGYNQNPLAAGGKAVNNLVDVGTGADVDALGRLVQDHEVGVGLHPLGDDDLLLVPAAESAGVGVGTTLHLILTDQLSNAFFSTADLTTPRVAIFGSTTRLMFSPLSKSLTKPSSRRSSVR